jgi:hypothetical protein
MLIAAGTVLIASCVPVASGGGSTEPPPATVVIDPTSGPAGTILHAAPADDHCLHGGSGTLQASVTMYSTGFVVTTGYQYVGFIPLSGNASNDKFVTLRIPPFAAAGKYLVHLTCFSYLDSYEYSPATFRVTS